MELTMTTRSASIFIILLFAAAGVSPLTARAQGSARPDPGNPGTPSSADKPASAFDGYKPFSEQPVRSWKDANQEVADNPGMGSMANMPGMNMPGMDTKAAMPGMNMPGMNSKSGAAANGKLGGAMAGMGSMPGMNMPGDNGTAAAAGKSDRAMPGKSAMAGMNMPGMDSKGTAAEKGKAGSAMPGMGAMPAKGAMPAMDMGGAHAKEGHQEASKTGGAMPGMSASGMAPKDEHAPAARAGGSMPGMAMPGMGSKSSESESAVLAGTGVVRAVDKPSGKIQITHDPVAAVNWPRMTIMFRLKNASLADQAKQGDKVKFVLTRTSTGYVISELQNIASVAPNPTK